ncbi:MAG: hypothetical protein Q8O92_11745 [Candidatus Latescibacter sp.]|nr:hypothetical protein [Candidatus Latescibacter sp.]
MENKKKKSQEKKTEPHEFRYEDLLDGFSMKEEDDATKNIPVVETPDMDDQALAELLGDEAEKRIVKKGADSLDTALEDDTDLEKEFEKLDLSSVSEELEADTVTAQPGTRKKLEMDVIAVDSAEPDIKKPEFVIEEDQGGYASLLSQLENEEKPEEPAESKEGKPEVDFSDLELEKLAGLDLEELSDKDEYNRDADRKVTLSERDTRELPSLDDEPSDEPAIMDAEADKEVSSDVNEPEKPAPEMDFLGLSGIQSKPEKSAKSVLSLTEVLFEGVEMDFDEQIDAVTHAELLLAQGKRKEAANAFQHLSETKGVTHWVSKRLRMLTVPEK